MINCLFVSIACFKTYLNCAKLVVKLGECCKKVLMVWILGNYLIK